MCKLLENSSNVSNSRLYFMQSLIPAGQVVVLGSRQHHLLLLLLLLQKWLPASMASSKPMVKHDRQQQPHRLTAQTALHHPAHLADFPVRCNRRVASLPPFLCTVYSSNCTTTPRITLKLPLRSRRTGRNWALSPAKRQQNETNEDWTAAFLLSGLPKPLTCPCSWLS